MGNTYLHSTIIIINFPILSAASVGQDGIDGSRAY